MSTGKADTKNTYAITGMYLLGFILLGVVTGTHGPAIPAFAAHTTVSLQTISIVFSAISAGHLTGSVIASRLYDVVQGHRIMAAALVLMAVCLYGSALTQTLMVLVALSFGVGLAKSALNVGSNTLLMWLHGEKVAPYMSALHFSFGFGAFLGPMLVTSSIAQSGGIARGFGLVGLATVLVALGCIALKSPPPPQDRKNPSTAALSSYVLLLVLLVFLYVGTEVGFGGWIFTYAGEIGIRDAKTKGYLTSSFWGALTLTRLLLMPVMARLRPQVVLYASLLACGLSLAVMLHSEALVPTVAGTIGMGMGMASIFPTVIVLAQRQIFITGRIMGYLSVGASLGAMVIPWLIGQYIVNTGPVVFLWFILSAIGLAVAVLTYLLAKSKKIKTLHPA